MISGNKLIALTLFLTNVNITIIQQLPRTVDTLVLALILSVVSGFILGGLTYMNWIHGPNKLKDEFLRRKSDLEWTKTLIE